MNTLKQKLKLVLAAALLVVALLSVFLEAGVATLAPWLLLGALLAYPLLTRSNNRCTAFLVWKDEYSVGIESFDREHKRLLNLINNLRAAVLCSTGEEFERHNLDELLDYTRTHFKREERLMEEHSFFDYEGHKAQHDQMIDFVQRFVERYEEEGNRVLSEVADYLTQWLLQHINVTDKKYSTFFAEKGVS